MTAVHQVCTLDQAKALRVFGILQKSVFYWEKWETSEDHYLKYVDYPNKKIWNDTFSAFTSAELGIMLPYKFLNAAAASKNKFKGNWFHVWKTPEDLRDETFMAWGYRVIKDSACYTQTEAEARAAVLIHLLETGQITPEEINQRLAA
jgi:hypothetical protein